MHGIRWIGILVAALMGMACSPGSKTVGRAGLAESGGATSPIENYKEQRMREAMRGLDYSSGRVTLTAEAAEVARPGTEADGARLAAEAEAIFLTNDFPAAIAAYTKAVITYPRRAQTYLGLASALLPKGRFDEAEAAIRTALELEPRSPEARIALARLIEMRGENAPTIAAWKDVLAVDPRNAEAHARLAIATYYSGDSRGALEHVQACERLGGTLPAQFKDLIMQELSGLRTGADPTKEGAR